MSKKKSPQKARKELDDIAKRLKAGESYEDILDELDTTLGLDECQEQNETLDREWENNYRR